MPMLTLSFDVSGLIAAHQQLADQIEQRTLEIVQKIATQAHAFVVQKAREKLQGSSLEVQYVKNLELNPDDDGHSWVLKVPKKILWIEEGIPAGFDLMDGMLKSPKAKSGPSGKYLVIPFKHNKSPQDQSAFQKIMNDAVRTEMKKKDIPYGKIEKNPDGSPKMGLLHKFNVNTPQYANQLKPGVQGPQGHPMAVHPRPQGQEGPGGRPYLFGVNVNQKKKEGGGAEKDISTFRTASEKNKGKQFIHPGLKKAGLLDDARDWAEQEWQGTFLPQLKKDLGVD